LFDLKLFSIIASAMFHGEAVSVKGVPIEVTETSVQKIKKMVFTDGEKTVVALQQNPNTGTVYAAAAKRGHQVVQFKVDDKYVAVSIDGRVQLYTNKPSVGK
jgi:DNA/RNA endonuclease YhcR with UshA esterase domain